MTSISAAQSIFERVRIVKGATKCYNSRQLPFLPLPYVSVHSFYQSNLSVRRRKETMTWQLTSCLANIQQRE
jgi:hypothetical protein